MSNRKIKVVFFGTPAFAVPVLEALIVDKEIEVIAVVTQPDRPVGRKQEVKQSPVRRLAEVHGIKVFTPEKLDSEFAQKLRKTLQGSNPVSEPGLGLDPSGTIGIVAAYGLMIPKMVMKLFKLGMLNVHPSLLPKYRGASPVAGAIINGEVKTGVSIMQMTEKMDAGPVVAQWKEKVKPDDTGGGLTMRLFNQAAERLPGIVKAWVMFDTNRKSTSFRAPMNIGAKNPQRKRNQVRVGPFVVAPPSDGLVPESRDKYPPPQDESQASYTRKLKKEHGYFPLEAVRAALEGKDYPIEELRLIEAFPFLKTDRLFTERIPHPGECEGKVKAGRRQTQPGLRPCSAKKVTLLFERAIRALSPWPGVFSQLKVQMAKGKVKELRLKLLKSHLSEGKFETGNSKPETRLVLDQVQLEGKQPVSWKQFVEGYPGVV
jgi:methionyl-tRNA formyltransferase